jgi:HEAT repeat protein
MKKSATKAIRFLPLVRSAFLVAALGAWHGSMMASVSGGTAQDDASSPSRARVQVEIEKQKQRLNSTDVEERRDALMRLGLLRRAEASRAALSSLSDPLPIIRATAASALSALPSGESAAALIPLLNDHDEFVRQQVSYALGEMKNRAAVAALVERLDTDKLDSVRGAAAVALGRIGDETAVVALARVFSPGSGTQAGRKRKGGENEFVLRAAAYSLGEIGSRAAVPVLIQALSNDSVAADVRREAAQALGSIGDPTAVPALQSAVGGSDVYLSHVAADALRKIGSRAAAGRP